MSTEQSNTYSTEQTTSAPEPTAAELKERRLAALTSHLGRELLFIPGTQQKASVDVDDLRLLVGAVDRLRSQAQVSKTLADVAWKAKAELDALGLDMPEFSHLGEAIEAFDEAVRPAADA